MGEFLLTRLPPITGDFVDCVTSEKWRSRLAENLTPVIITPKKAMAWYLDRDESAPLSIQRMVLNEPDERTKKPGRPRRGLPSPEQEANDIACWLAVNWLVIQHGFRKTPASKKVAEKMKLLEGDSVLRAFDRAERLLEKSRK